MDYLQTTRYSLLFSKSHWPLCNRTWLGRKGKLLDFKGIWRQTCVLTYSEWRKLLSKISFTMWICAAMSSIGDHLPSTHLAGDEWVSAQETFWDLGNTFGAQGTAACNLNLSEMLNHSNRLEGYSAATRGVAFLWVLSRHICSLISFTIDFVDFLAITAILCQRC